MNLELKAKEIQTEITQLLRDDNVVDMSRKFDELDLMVELVASQLCAAKLIRQNCQTEIRSRLHKIRDELEIIDETRPTAAEIQLLQSRDHGMREVAPGIQLPVITVPTEDFIPDNPLYFVRATNEFAVRINNSVIRGSIRNISSGPRSIKCRDSECSDPECPWGHPLRDGQSAMNWSPGCWLYTSDALQKKNLHMRHVGSRDTLLSDIHQVTRGELATRAEQTAHDLLVQLAIDTMT